MEPKEGVKSSTALGQFSINGWAVAAESLLAAWKAAGEPAFDLSTLGGRLTFLAVQERRLPKRKKLKMSYAYGGHDVWIWGPSTGSRTTLRARVWIGATKCFEDQSDILTAWINGGCIGNCLPR